MLNEEGGGIRPANSDRARESLLVLKKSRRLPVFSGKCFRLPKYPDGKLGISLTSYVDPLTSYRGTRVGFTDRGARTFMNDTQQQLKWVTIPSS